MDDYFNKTMSKIGVDLNPSDEKLREMIAEKDREIEKWKERAEGNWPFEWQVATELTNENKKLREMIAEKDKEIFLYEKELKQIANDLQPFIQHGDRAGQRFSQIVARKMLEKDQEIASLKQYVSAEGK